MIGNPYPQFQNVQEWNDFVNEVRHSLATMGKNMADLYAAIEQYEDIEQLQANIEYIAMMSNIDLDNQ